MSADHYNQPELARIYDDENVWDASAELYCDLGRRIGAGSLLDLGCGTGTVTRGIAAALGCEAVGVDPAAPMLDVARRNTRDERVEWIEGDAREIRLDRKFDLIVMTGHAFQALLTDHDQARLFATFAAHLTPAGRFGFDSRNPGAQEWLEWNPEQSRRRIDTADYGAVDIWDEATMDSAGRILDVVEHYRIVTGDRRLRSDFQLRFTAREEMAARIAASGLTLEHCHGDWNGGPVTTISPEIIMIGRLSEQRN